MAFRIRKPSQESFFALNAIPLYSYAIPLPSERGEESRSLPTLYRRNPAYGRMPDMSSRKIEFVLGFKLALSGSPAAMNAPISYIAGATRRRLKALYAAEAGGTASGMRLKGGGRDEKIWRRILLVFCPCNPLKSHKMAKALFGKA